MAEYTINEENGRLILHLKGELVLNAVTELKDEIKSHLKNENLKVIADLSDVEFVDSSGLGMLISWFKCVNEENGRIVFANVQPYVRKIIKISKLDKIFTLAETLDEAKELL